MEKSEELQNLKNNKIIKSSYFENFLSSKKFNYSNGYNDKLSHDEKNDIATFIRANNTSLKTDELMLRNVHKKILSYEKIFREILTYEFLFYDPIEKITNVDNLIKVTINELKKYQGIIGGFYFEDLEWRECTSESRFKIKKNQKALYNSAEKIGCYDRDQMWFLRNFMNHMKRFIEKDSNLLIDYKLIDDENNDICWTLLVFEEKRAK